MTYHLPSIPEIELVFVQLIALALLILAGVRLVLDAWEPIRWPGNGREHDRIDRRIIGVATIGVVNKEQLRRLAGHEIRLHPPSIHLDMLTGEPKPPRDDIWRVAMNFEHEGLPISNTYTKHGFVLPYDHIREFMSDPIGPTKGMLILKTQIYLRGDDVKVVPIVRSEPV